MSRALALGLILFGAMDGTLRPPPTGIAPAIPRDGRDALIRNAAELERRRAVETAILAPQVHAVVIQERPAAPAVLAPPGVIVRQPWSDQMIAHLIFRPHGSVDEARRRLVAELALQIVELDRVCELTYAQKRKLRLAGRGDIKRFFDRYEAVKQKVQTTQNNNQMFQNVLAQHIVPLQRAFQAGLFDEKSLLLKTLRNTLTREQFAQYEAMARKAGRVVVGDDRDDGAGKWPRLPRLWEK